MKAAALYHILKISNSLTFRGASDLLNCIADNRA